MTSRLIDLNNVKGKPCSVCSEIHIIQNRCRYEAMASRISKLLEANSLIPQILQHNKEATTLAQHYLSLLKKADEAHTLLMEELSAWGETGEKIKNNYLERLDKWASQHTSQDTSDQAPPSSQESSIPSESEAKPSTEETTSGESSPLIF